MPAPRQSTPVNEFDGVRPQMAKAALPVNGSQFGLTAIVRDGLVRACGSLKAAAITMGIDQGQLTRDLQSGAFKLDRLERLSATEKAVIVGGLHEAFGPLASSPKARAHQTLDQIQASVNELRQAVELIP